SPTISPTFTVTPTPPVWANQGQILLLKGVYPNPSDGPLNVFGVLNQPAHWRMAVFSVSGEQVWQAEGDAPAGNLVIVWPAANGFGAEIASGIYGVKLNAVGLSGEQGDAWK